MKGKKQMKKMISILLCAVMVLSLAACQAAEPAQTEEAATTAAAATAAATQAATTAAAVTQAAETEAAPAEEEYLPLVKPGDDPVTLTVGIMQKADVESYEDNDFTKFTNTSHMISGT